MSPRPAWPRASTYSSSCAAWLLADDGRGGFDPAASVAGLGRDVEGRISRVDYGDDGKDDTLAPAAASACWSCRRGRYDDTDNGWKVNDEPPESLLLGSTLSAFDGTGRASATRDRWVPTSTSSPVAVSRILWISYWFKSIKHGRRTGIPRLRFKMMDAAISLTAAEKPVKLRFCLTSSIENTVPRRPRPLRRDGYNSQRPRACQEGLAGLPRDLYKHPPG
jgi:hypothetical protein